MRTIYLVACSGSKAAASAPAADLYTGKLFGLQRQFIRRQKNQREPQWFILSALHGLIEPATTIAPYEQTLKAAAYRRDWSARMLATFLTRFEGEEELHLVVFAGKLYREWLEPLQAARPGWRVEIPLYGLGIGKQIAAMKRLLEG